MTVQNASSEQIYRRDKPLSTQHPLWHEAFYPKEAQSHHDRQQSILRAWDAFPIPWSDFFAHATEAEFNHVLSWLYATPTSGTDYLIPTCIRPSVEELAHVLYNVRINESGLSRIGAYRSMPMTHLDETILWVWVLFLNTYNTCRPTANESPEIHTALALLRRIPSDWVDVPHPNNTHKMVKELRNSLLRTLMVPSCYCPPDVTIPAHAHAPTSSTTSKPKSKHAEVDTPGDTAQQRATQGDHVCTTLRKHVVQWIQKRKSPENDWYRFVHHCMSQHQKDADHFIHAMLCAIQECPILWVACEEESWRKWLLKSEHASQWSEMVFIKAWHGHLLNTDEIACQPRALALYHRRHTPAAASMDDDDFPLSWSAPLALAKSGVEFWSWINMLAQQDTIQACDIPAEASD